MRAYNYTYDRKFLDEGRAAMAQIKETLVNTETLAAKATHLVKLKDSLAEAKKGVTDYERLMNETEKNVLELEKIAGTLNENAEKYNANANALLKGQNENMISEIKAGIPAADLTERLTKITLVNDLIDEGNKARLANLRSRAQRDPDIMKQGIAEVFPVIEEKGRALDAITRQAEDKQQLRDILAAGNNYKNAMQGYLNVFLELSRLNAARVEAADHVLGSASGLMRAAVEQTTQIANGAAVSLGQASTIVLIGVLVALVIGSLLAFFITRSITLPIRRITDGLNEGAEQVSSASGQISSASQSLAEGASEQAASIEETSSSLEEMSSMTKQNAENAGQADTLMKEANHVVKQANDSMNQVTSSMQEITKASEETSKIIKTIDEIAFQTNLLALNAAVEAARAGEAGAGFAVVADEVRNLAMRAAEAAKNTANLIEGTVKKVKDGSELVTKTNDAFAQVAESSKKVGELVGEISAASNEQAQGIEQVNKAVTEMDKVVQQNAANAEEAASASEEMNAQANQMKSIVEELMAMVGGGNSRKAGMAASDYSKKSQVHHSIAHLKAHDTSGGKGKGKSAMAHQHKDKKAEKLIPMENDFSDF
jgi:methyl-accepting chemotaxis protein